MHFAAARILLFAKAPVPGRVKTRLIPSVGAQRAAEIYHTLLEGVIDEATREIAFVEIWCAPDTRHALFQAAAKNPAITLHAQTTGDLGQRMAYAAQQALARSEMVLLIGGDCPELKAEHLRLALAWLDAGVDAVLGPAEDGGYVLLGMRRMHRQLFCDIPWSTDQVLDITRQRLAQLGWIWRELEPLWDLDRDADLQRYLRLGGVAQ